ncbi:MAG TPA: glucosamine-6-phosphate deaminase, partial [Cytophagaceae bacterium]
MIKTTSQVDLSKRFERVNVEIFNNSILASKAVAKEIASLITEKKNAGKHCVLGLATGSSPKYIYAELVRMHKEEGLSFANVYSFNLDEYYPMAPDSLQSYVRFMKENLFDHVDIPRENWMVPDGTLAPDKINQFCESYEQRINDLGGIDFQLVGIGGNGHIGFNEPGSRVDSKTRLIALDHVTRAAASRDFSGLINTPKKAITLGVSQIMAAKRVVLIAWGEGKVEIIRKAVEEPVSEQVPASYLQNHPNCSFYIDESAAAQLTRIKTPWLVETVEWDKKLIKKAVTSLAL